MAYIKNTWVDQEVERPKTYEMVNNSDGTVTLVDSFGLVSELGTPVNADNMNHIEEGIEDHDRRLDILEGEGARADVNLSNLTEAGQAKFDAKVNIDNMVDISEAGQDITNSVMPDYSAGISIANDTLFTAPSDGWIVCRQNADNNSGQVIIAEQTFVTINESGNSSIAQCSTFLISKEETFSATLVQTCVFFPLKGVQ